MIVDEELSKPLQTIVNDLLSKTLQPIVNDLLCTTVQTIVDDLLCKTLQTIVDELSCTTPQTGRVRPNSPGEDGEITGRDLLALHRPENYSSAPIMYGSRSPSTYSVFAVRHSSICVKHTYRLLVLVKEHCTTVCVVVVVLRPCNI